MEEEKYKYCGDFLNIRLENGIVICKFKSKVIDIGVAKGSIKERLEFTKHQKFPVLVDITDIEYTSKEARDYLASDEASQYLSSIAVLVNSSVGKIIYNFYARISMPKIPTKMFNEERKAMEWLQEFK